MSAHAAIKSRTEPEAGPAPARAAELTELGMAFRRVFRTLNRLRGRDTHLGGAELSHAQFELLIELDERGELPAGELAAAARLAPGTVTQMLDHLAGCGHVERVRSQTDRRVVVTRLTAQGRRQIEAKREAWQSRWEQALQDVGVRELRAAKRVLERLGAMLEDAPASGVCEPAETGPRAAAQAPAQAARK
ncbi:MAG TPA: MarR family winged helix-turn-helix transcriptional regulator [Solirubrobacteraceae bacterium]|nr:MarR family winged helix-turn-helix transcriptional regulator [Solirubrobacteraceae bacterium]